MKKNKILLTAAGAVLILTATIGSAFAYFSTYEKALGGYVLHLDDYEEHTEEFQDWTKQIWITSKADSKEDVFVRMRAFAGEDITLQYIAGDEWSPAADGFYYYNGILKPGESSSEIDVKISNIPMGVDLKSFNVAVVYEATPVRYNPDGTPYADWSEVLDVTDIVTGGDN